MWRWICGGFRNLRQVARRNALGGKQEAVFIPKNFAHGFLVLSDYAEFAYKCTDFYHPNDEGGILWSDPEIGVKWPIPEGMEPVMSDKDKKWEDFRDFHKIKKAIT